MDQNDADQVGRSSSPEESGLSLPGEDLSNLALELARQAATRGEVPVGALVFRLNPVGVPTPVPEILGRGHNRILERKDPSAHAEILAIREACALENSERLDNCGLISTLEPCLMCSGAIILARLKAVFYFAPLKRGVGLSDLPRRRNSDNLPLNHLPLFFHLERRHEETAEIMREFFRQKRRNSDK